MIDLTQDFILNIFDLEIQCIFLTIQNEYEPRVLKDLLNSNLLLLQNSHYIIHIFQL